MIAHAKWFVDWRSYPTEYGLLFSERMLFTVVVAVVLVAAAWWVHRNIPEPRPLLLFDRFIGWGPFFVGTHAGLPLLVASLTGRLFAPHLLVAREDFGAGVLAFEGAVGLLLVLGLFTRFAALGLAILGPLAASHFGWEGILEQVHFLGVALFLFLIGRGPLSLDRALPVGIRIVPTPTPSWAVTMLRVLAGFSVAFSALTEKILNPRLSEALLGQRPELNVLRPLGVDHAAFVLLAGITEFAIGAWIASGQVTRLAIILAWFPFNLSLIPFGWDELLGHLPIYGIMFLLLVASQADAWHVRTTLRRHAAAA